MGEKVQYYDLILVYTSYRRHNNYLNIIKYLGPKFSIGVLRFEPKHEWGESEEIYWRLCLQYGAKEVKGDTECHSLMISRFGKGTQRGYYEDIIEDVPRSITYKKVFYNMDSPMMGVPYLDEICKNLGKPILLVPSIKYFDFLDGKYASKEAVEKNGLEMVEVGTPYAKYPIFEDFETDYLFAYPSQCSVQSRWEDYHLLKNIVKVLRQLPSDAKIILKPHNARDTGNRLSYTNKKLKIMPLWLIKILLSFGCFFEIKWKGKSKYNMPPDKVLQYCIHLQNEYIFKRCDNLLDKYPAFGFEHFVRGIKKGVITGISQTILESLLQKKPVCVCDDLPLEKKPENYQIIYKVLGISKWKRFSTAGFDKIDDSVWDADLIGYLKRSIDN